MFDFKSGGSSGAKPDPEFQHAMIELKASTDSIDNVISSWLPLLLVAVYVLIVPLSSIADICFFKPKYCLGAAHRPANFNLANRTCHHFSSLSFLYVKVIVQLKFLAWHYNREDFEIYLRAGYDPVYFSLPSDHNEASAWSFAQRHATSRVLHA